MKEERDFTDGIRMEGFLPGVRNALIPPKKERGRRRL